MTDSAKSLVWADSPISIMGHTLSFGTAVWKDIAVGGVGVILFIVGFMMMMHEDIGDVVNLAAKVAP